MSDSINHLFIGWDVGAWNCDNNKSSKDALCVLAYDANTLAVKGTPWRGNLRSVLDESKNTDVMQQFLSKCKIECDQPFDCTIAIDTPLGWPSPMLELVQEGHPSPVPAKADDNPYLFRMTELDLFEKGHRPLSAIRDMIGSQSTKGIHFLTAVQFARKSTGVWKKEFSECHWTAIETYPAPCKKSSRVKKHFKSLKKSKTFEKKCSKGRHVRADVEDALRCAIVAYLFDADFACLGAPGDDVYESEGWIWVPKDCLPTEGATT